MKTLDETPTACRPSAQPLVLIVNGDPAMRVLLENIVNAAGLRSVSFGSAAEYFGRSRLSGGSCAILDVVLPDACGLEVQERLASDGIPVVFVTREASIASCVRALKAGAVDFLMMPCGSEELLNAVRSAVGEALRARAEREKLRALSYRLKQLTPRERQVFALVASGLLNKHVAQQLGISEITVQIHRGRVMKKMGARSFAALVRMADALQAAPPAGSSSISSSAPVAEVRAREQGCSRSAHQEPWIVTFTEGAGSHKNMIVPDMHYAEPASVTSGEAAELR